MNKMYDYNYPAEPIYNAKIDTTGLNSVTLGCDERGKVERLGPFGNLESDTTINYLIGMHTYESKAHKAVFDVVIEHESELRYKYYIYKISVEQAERKGYARRMGQFLAQDFIYPDVKENRPDFVIDVHSNHGTVGYSNYTSTRFLYAPGLDEISTKYMNQLLDVIDELEYYAPKSQSSPQFITIPISKENIPVIVFETYGYEQMKDTYDLAQKVVKEVDNLEYK